MKITASKVVPKPVNPPAEVHIILDWDTAKIVEDICSYDMTIPEKLATLGLSYTVETMEKVLNTLFNQIHAARRG